MRHIPLTKSRLDAIIDALTEVLAGQPGNRHDYEGALSWATTRHRRMYHEKEAAE
jgi:hypothetical protein